MMTVIEKGAQLRRISSELERRAVAHERRLRDGRWNAALLLLLHFSIPSPLNNPSFQPVAQPKEFEAVIEPLFRRISRCLTSSHFQVAERSLFLWNNDAIVLLVTQYKDKVLPLVIGALEENAAHHWNSAVHRWAGPGGLGGGWLDQDPTVVLPT